jgi:hypothetical protein
LLSDRRGRGSSSQGLIARRFQTTGPRARPRPSPETGRHIAGRRAGSTQAARQRHETAEFAATYALQAAIEGTISRGVQVFDLRRARYRGLARTHLEHVATAAAVNLRRFADWLIGVPRAATRCPTFAALASPA